MSFNIDTATIIQYAYNLFASSETMLYMWVGASFGAFVLGRLLNIAKH